MRVTERFRRVDFGHMQFQVTFDDPQTLTRPLTISLKVDYAADTDMLENECNENNRDEGHLGGQETARVKLSLAVLARYAGTYEFREGGRRNVLPADPDREPGQWATVHECSAPDSAIGHNLLKRKPPGSSLSWTQAVK
jgi:hypothetical protein